MNNITHAGCTATAYTGCPGCVRLAEPGDEGQLVDMIQAMHGDTEWMLRDSGGEPFPFNEGKVRDAVRRALHANRTEPDVQAWIGVVGAPGKLHGSTCVILQSPWCADGSYLIERWNWVYPEYRKSDTSKSLISFSIAIADRMQLTLVSASLPKELSAKSRLYERKIGAPVGSIFQYSRAGA